MMSLSLALCPLLLLSIFSGLAGAQQSFFPASIPLAVRSPYFNIWDISTNGSGPLSDSWPHFWGQQSIIGWAGKIRVDGQTYAWMGNDRMGNGPANVTDIQITPTRSIYTMQAGPMNLTVTFLSPIEPSDLVNQSLPFSYLSVEASSTDGAQHSVQLYSDISAELLSGNRSALVKWSNVNTGSSIYHEVELENPIPNTEIANQAQDGTVYFGMALRPGLTWEIDTDKNVRNQFVTQGSLNNLASTAFGPINNPFYVYAVAVDLGQIQSTSPPVTWALGYVRDPSVQYTTYSGNVQSRRPYFVTRYPDIGSAIDAFTGDFSATNNRAVALDQKITGDAAKVSKEYADLVSLAARQTFGSLDITVLADDQGKPDPSDVKIFMKDIGYSMRISPVERMFAAFPAYLYLNASFGAGLLAPLLESQDALSGQKYAARDLGTNYPVATGALGTHNEGVEQTGNMLIMTYAYARLSGEGELLSQHYNLTKRWADYLVANTLTPTSQNSADGENAANMTNLAIKGIIGVKAMAEISRALGEDTDAQLYDGHASALVSSWQTLAQSADQKHLLGIYGSQQNWALMYNMYADKLLGTKLIPQSVYDGQTQFYSTLLTTAPALGLPFDSTAGQTSSSAWSLLTSATVSDDGVRNQLIHGVWARANSNATLGVFPDKYNDGTGVVEGGNAGPALGAMFSHLALTVPAKSINAAQGSPGSGSGNGTDGSGSNGGSNSGSDTKSSSSVGPIVGGVVGAVVIIALGFGAIFYLRKKRREQEREDDGEKIEIFEEPHRPTLKPYYYNQQTRSSSVPLARGPESEYAADQSQAGSGSGYTTDPGVASFNAQAMYHDSTDVAYAGYEPAPMPIVASQNSKAMEVARNQPHQYASSVDATSAVGSQAPSASSQDPLSPGTVASLSSTDVIGLRAEVENLRRVMLEIRQERLEPPPEYGA